MNKSPKLLPWSKVSIPFIIILICFSNPWSWCEVNLVISFSSEWSKLIYRKNLRAYCTVRKNKNNNHGAHLTKGDFDQMPNKIYAYTYIRIMDSKIKITINSKRGWGGGRGMLPVTQWFDWELVRLLTPREGAHQKFMLSDIFQVSLLTLLECQICYLLMEYLNKVTHIRIASLALSSTFWSIFSGNSSPNNNHVFKLSRELGFPMAWQKWGPQSSPQKISKYKHLIFLVIN